MEKIAAPIDNKNLLEDPFEDEVFGDFYAAPDHRRTPRTRHLIGRRKVLNEDGFDCDADALVDAFWKYGDNCVDITLLAVPRKEDDWEYTRREIFDSYKREFKAWECEDNPGLVVEFKEIQNTLYVLFYYTDKP